MTIKYLLHYLEPLKLHEKSFSKNQKLQSNNLNLIAQSQKHKLRENMINERKKKQVEFHIKHLFSILYFCNSISR